MFNRRYERNFKAITPAELDVLRSKNLCVLGCGGLGGYVVDMLARLGVCRITVVDFDVFEETNLNRQTFATEGSIGKPKAVVCKERLLEINSEVTIRPVVSRFSKENASEILAGHHVAVDALDNIGAKMLLAQACAELNIPMVHGAIGGWYGQIATILPGDKTLDILYGGGAEKGIEQTLGNLSFSASLVASLQSAEVVKLLTGRGDLLTDGFMRVDLLNNDFTVINIYGDKNQTRPAE